VTPPQIRQVLHVLHVLATLVLLATGLLIEWPDLRARVIGGYGRQLADIHEWASVVFIAAPLLALALAARPLLADLRRRLGPPDGVTWRKVHIVSTLGFGILLVVTGAVLWIDREVRMPLAVFDSCLWLHDAATWVLLASIPVHIFAARRKIVGRSLELLGRAPPPPFPEDDLDA
jgi:cytochrome b subunit of formate dehydrogenase